MAYALLIIAVLSMIGIGVFMVVATIRGIIYFENCATKKRFLILEDDFYRKKQKLSYAIVNISAGLGFIIMAILLIAYVIRR